MKVYNLMAASLQIIKSRHHFRRKTSKQNFFFSFFSPSLMLSWKKQGTRSALAFRCEGKMSQQEASSRVKYFIFNASEAEDINCVTFEGRKQTGPVIRALQTCRLANDPSLPVRKRAKKLSFFKISQRVEGREKEGRKDWETAMKGKFFLSVSNLKTGNDASLFPGPGDEEKHWHHWKFV